MLTSRVQISCLMHWLLSGQTLTYLHIYLQTAADQCPGSDIGLIKQVTWLAVTEVWSKSFWLVTECRHYNRYPIYGYGSSVGPILFFIIKCSIIRFLCAVHMLCRYSTSRHHPHPLGYPCAKFHFFCTVHCWAIPCRKTAHSLTHSLTFSPLPLLT